MSNRHLLIPTQYYDPEVFQVNHLVSLFLTKGWKVTVIAPSPSYPSASAFKNSTSPVFKHERLTICRFPVIKRNGSLLFAALNSVLFAVAGSTLVLLYAFRYPKASIFAVQYSPFTCIIPAVIGGFLLRKRASLWIFDLWPQSMSTLVGSSLVNKYAYSIVEEIASVFYSQFSSVYVSSPDFIDIAPVSRLADAKILYSWEPKGLLSRLGGKQVDRSGAIHLASIGNLGSAHDLSLLQELLLLTKKQNIRWSFVGGGHGVSVVQAFCADHDIDNVRFYGFLPKEECLEICSEADMSIVPFKDSEVSNTVCYRFVSSLSVGTPVISFGENAVSRFIMKSNCGFVLARSGSQERIEREQSKYYSSSALVDAISSQVAFIRSACRDFSYGLYESHFSESAAEATLSTFFA